MNLRIVFAIGTLVAVSGLPLLAEELVTNGLVFGPGRRARGGCRQIAVCREMDQSGQGSEVRDFVRQDEGRRTAGSGRPRLRRNVAAIGGRNSIVFKRQELVNDQDDAFDALITGTGHTWFCSDGR